MSAYQVSGDLPTGYTNKMRKYAELGNEVKQQLQVEAVYTSLVTTSSTGVIPCMSSSDYTHQICCI